MSSLFYDGPLHGQRVSVQDLSDSELAAFLDACRTEYQRRQNLASALEASPDLAVAAQVVAGREPGNPWTQPLGAFDAYPEGWQVERDGRLWESLIPANTFEPGVSGWREISVDGSPTEWVQPSGAHDAYMKGDLVTHNGATWVSDLDHNPYRPGEHGWTVTD